MNVARILYPVRVLGPGERIGIWVCGCGRACKGCSNPELWERRPEREVSPQEVLSLVQKVADLHPVDGFTISGGEPMDQAEDLASFMKLAAGISDDFLIYTGYRVEELRSRGDAATDYILQETSILIDGAYVEEQNDNSVLRGSSNQRIHVCNSRYKERYADYFATACNQIQNFSTADGIVSVGIHRKTF